MEPRRSARLWVGLGTTLVEWIAILAKETRAEVEIPRCRDYLRVFFLYMGKLHSEYSDGGFRLLEKTFRWAVAWLGKSAVTSQLLSASGLFWLALLTQISIIHWDC